MALIISILLASVILALAIVYALLMQTWLFRIFDFNITRRRIKAFLFWNSIAFVFKVVLPIFLLIPSGFLIWILASYWHWHWGGKEFVVFDIAAIILVCALSWLNKGVQSVQRSFEADYHQERLSIPWWSIMLLTWLLAFPLSHLTIAPYMGGYAHMQAHNFWVGSLKRGHKSDCWICRKVKELEKKGASTLQPKVKLSDIDFKDYFSGRRLAYAEWKDCISKLEAANLTYELKSNCAQVGGNRGAYVVVRSSPFDEEWMAVPKLNESYNEYLERWYKPVVIHKTPRWPPEEQQEESWK